MGAHADSDDAELGDAAFFDHLASADLFGHAVDDGTELFEFIGAHREGNVGRSAYGDILDDDIDDHIRLGEGCKNAGGGAGFVGHLCDGDLGLFAFEADAAHDDIFESDGFFFHDGSPVVVETAAHLERHFEFFGEFDRAGLHDLGSATGHFEKLVVSDLLDLLGIRHHTRVAGINAVDIRVDLAHVGLESRRNGDGCEVGAAASKCGDLPLERLALESGDDADIALVEKFADLPWGDVGDFCLCVNTACDDSRLRAGERNRLAAERIDRHRGESDCGLLAGGEENIHFPFGGCG